MVGTQQNWTNFKNHSGNSIAYLYLLCHNALTSILLYSSKIRQRTVPPYLSTLLPRTFFKILHINCESKSILFNSYQDFNRCRLPTSSCGLFFWDNLPSTLAYLSSLNSFKQTCASLFVFKNLQKTFVSGDLLSQSFSCFLSVLSLDNSRYAIYS